MSEPKAGEPLIAPNGEPMTMYGKPVVWGEPLVFASKAFLEGQDAAELERDLRALHSIEPIEVVESQHQNHPASTELRDSEGLRVRFIIGEPLPPRFDPSVAESLGIPPELVRNDEMSGVARMAAELPQKQGSWRDRPPLL